MFLESHRLDHLRLRRYKNDNFNEQDHSDWRKNEI